MFEIRGKPIKLRAPTLTEIGQVYDSILVLSTCTPTIKVMHPQVLPHLYRVIAVVVRKSIPDVTLDEVSDAINTDNIEEVLLGISDFKPPTPLDMHQEHGHA